MLQFYFLSVLCTFLSATTLIVGELSGRLTSLAPLKDLLGNRGSKVTLGFSSLIVGVVKFSVRAPFDTSAGVGDLLPAFAGIGLGLALLTDFFKERVSKSSEVVEKAEHLAGVYRIPLGVVGIIAAVLHFLFPATVIL